MIKLIHLTKTYKDLRAVDDLNLEVKEGALFGFLGPNGAGKTTTIKMMAGVLKPTSGRVIIDGMDLAEEPEKVKKCIGFIPDRPYLYEKLTGMEFLKFIAGLYGMDHAGSLQTRIHGLLELFDLTHWSDELIESYSHGMKQRLVMCSALLPQPRVLIVDEPMVGLDPRGARLVKDLFVEQALKKTTVFMSTHSLEVAAEVCQDIAIIQAGRIIARGSAEELRQTAGVDGSLESVFLKLTEGKRIAHATPLSAS
ncbi:MAG: ABC transporter ATP-binding protein [Desulfobacterota bacterium]|jgi:ABC-2 type transport system ATP-binding protein|nr:ABC transporter ATP-binding protein [Thermodesulfobacteriota bacterium]